MTNCKVAMTVQKADHLCVGGTVLTSEVCGGTVLAELTSEGHHSVGTSWVSWGIVGYRDSVGHC